MSELTNTQFKGIKNDVGQKHVPPEYFFNAVNFNYDSIVGADKILMPDGVYQNSADPVDGAIEYRYLDENNVLQKKEVVVQGGKVFVNQKTNASVLANDFKKALLYNDNIGPKTTYNTIKKMVVINGRDEYVDYYGTDGVNGARADLNTSGIMMTKNVVSFWANDLYDNAPGQYYLQPESTPKAGFFVQVSLPLISFGQYSPFQGFSFKTYNLPATGIMSNYTMIAKNGTIFLYINGVLQNHVARSYNLISNQIIGNMFINSDTATSATLNTIMYDINIYDYDLLTGTYTDQEIVDFIYNNNLYGYKFGNELAALETEVYSGITSGLVDMAVYNDKLFIANGKDYPLIYWGAKNVFYQMGAPAATVTNSPGLPTGLYYYAMTYITSGGEEVIGTISNTIAASGQQIKLYLPLGYDGVTDRKIYRTEAGGTTLKLLTTLGDNSTLTYIDNQPDAALGAEIPAINNECPKPYFLRVQYNRLVGAKIDKLPTQIAITDTGIELFDTAMNVDISNQATDNTPINGIEMDYAVLMVGTSKNLFMVDVSNTIVTVTSTRSNIGVKNGYTMVRVPSNGVFDGGVMFVSTENDIRLISGYKNIIPNTVNDISTDNWAQVLQGTLKADIIAATRLYAEFYDYKYHLIVSDKKYVFDIRTQSWSVHSIETENYTSTPTIMAVLNDKLYNGQPTGWLEREYSSIQYRGEDVTAFLESPMLTISNDWSMIKDFIFWFIASSSNDVTVEVVCNDDDNNAQEATFTVDSGVFDGSIYSPLYYDTDGVVEDYRAFHVSKQAMWVKFKIICTKGRLLFRGYRIMFDEQRNREG